MWVPEHCVLPAFASSAVLSCRRHPKGKSSLKPDIKVHHKSVCQGILRRKIKSYISSFCLFRLSCIVSQCKKWESKVWKKRWGRTWHSMKNVWDNILPSSPPRKERTDPLQCTVTKFHFIFNLTCMLRKGGMKGGRAPCWGAKWRRKIYATENILSFYNFLLILQSSLFKYFLFMSPHVYWQLSWMNQQAFVLLLQEWW